MIRAAHRADQTAAHPSPAPGSKPPFLQLKLWPARHCNQKPKLVCSPNPYDPAQVRSERAKQHAGQAVAVPTPQPATAPPPSPCARVRRRCSLSLHAKEGERVGAMPIVSEAARRADSGSSGFGRRDGSPSSSTVVPGSDSRAAVLQCDEREESDGEVQSSYRGPFETMEALQDALPSNRSVSPIRGFVNLSSSGYLKQSVTLCSSALSRNLGISLVIVRVKWCGTRSGCFGGCSVHKRCRGTATDDCLKSLVPDRSGWWMLWYRGWIRTVVDLVCLDPCCSIASDIWGPLM